MTCISDEPYIPVFWTRGTNSAQHVRTRDTAYREIRRIAPEAAIVGSSLAFTPQDGPGERNTWPAHVKSAGTVPDQPADRQTAGVTAWYLVRFAQSAGPRRGAGDRALPRCDRGEHGRRALAELRGRNGGSNQQWSLG